MTMTTYNSKTETSVTKAHKSTWLLLSLAVLVLTGFAGVASAADVEVYLKAQRFNKTLPTGGEAPMWGFAWCTSDAYDDCTLPDNMDAPGPQIDGLFKNDNLTINVQNALPMPVSIMIPGQANTGLSGAAPGAGRTSFAAEIAPGETGFYTFGMLKAGTYIYQSATYPSVQVPMGLYGALIVQEDTTSSYPGIPATSEHLLLFSEIDLTQNTRVDLNVAAAMAAAELDPSTITTCTPLEDYLATMAAGMPCTIDYDPMYFFVNGEPTITMPPGSRAEATLLRMANAGLRSHTPSIVGVEFELLAEDGNLYPIAQWQSTALLAAGKTLDARVTLPDADVTLRLFDRMPTFGNENLPNGGSLAGWDVGLGSGTPPTLEALAADDAYTATEDQVLTVAAPGVLFNDDPSLSGATVVGGGAAHGDVVLSPDGSFTYTPDDDYSGPDSFTYSAQVGGTSYLAQVSLSVQFVNDAPVAKADGPYFNGTGNLISVAAPGVLGNDSDVDGDSLTAELQGTPAGVTLDPNGSFTYDGGAVSTSTETTFNYRACDTSSVCSAYVTVTLTHNPVAGISLQVEDDGGAPVEAYRWIVEEDAMWQPDPMATPVPQQTLATNFHRSHMPVVAQGTTGVDPATDINIGQVALDPSKHYFVSVLPLDAMDEGGHTIGGARILPGQTAVTVKVNNLALPTAQISIFVFEDNAPTNGAVDGNEVGLGGFQITLEDAGGRYGASGGTMSQDAFGQPLTNALDCFGGADPAPGVILSCPDTPENRAAELVGEVLIKNLYQGKYGIIVSKPLNGVTDADTGINTKDWVQTSTIEGTKVIDAWVKAGEPPFFQEFGPAGWHVFVGFVSPTKTAAIKPTGGNSVTGHVSNMHMSRPPVQTLYGSTNYDALGHTQAWVGINSANGTGANYAAVQATVDEATGRANFTIDGLPDGVYQLVIWDSYLDQVIAYKTVTLPGDSDVGEVPVFQWFTRSEHNVFLDDGCGEGGAGIAGDGIRQACEVGIPEQNVNLRWRDGTVNQAFPTDTEGFVPFDETFPFFHWQVLEVDYARFKPTGVTVTVDGGGELQDATGYVLRPQIQNADADECTDASCLSRTETGPVLTAGFQGFLGQTSTLDWGKAPYAEGENGGISGIVYYASTRAENNPRLGVGEPWEPGVPGVTVRLYREVPRDLEGLTTALVLVEETQTDSWDESPPEGCPGAAAIDEDIVGLGPTGLNDKCYDGLRNFNQVRPAVFDGGYAFGADGSLAPGKYVVEVVPPPGYELVAEESVNVGFGDTYNMDPAGVTFPGGAVGALPDYAMVADALVTPGLAQPPCVGELHEVPAELTLFPVGERAPFAGALRPYCDRKEVLLSDQGQSAADFFLYTSTPISGHYVGMILDDTAQEFNPLSPQFGEKWAPPFVPVSVHDHLGNEISRVYSDQWGRFNGLLPSTFTANMPSPSGYAPAMLMTCMNDPGPIPGPNFAADPTDLITDPQYNPAYSTFCYTFQYMPGTTTYLDTPVLPVSAFASGYNPPDCEPADGTPKIRQVDGTGVGPLVAPAGTLTILSQGSNVPVPNPAYTGPGGTEAKTTDRDFGFGTEEGEVTLDGVPLDIVSWTPDQIEVTAPDSETEGQLIVTRSNGNSTDTGITVTVSNETPIRVPGDFVKIQDAIDAASSSALILVGPGTYNELLVMWKPVRLQGVGSATFLNGVKRPTEKIVDWRTKMDCLFGVGTGCPADQFDKVDPLPNQLVGAAGFDTEEGAAITVVGQADTGITRPNQAPVGIGVFRRGTARIDGFSITGGDTGGGIFVNGYAHNLVVSNNDIFGNSGSYHGGIRIGRPFLELTDEELVDERRYSFNRNVSLHHNAITQNGGLDGAGGGVSLMTGTDAYNVSENFVCGNFSMGDGGGIGHLGLSDGGVIANNEIIFNQSFNQGQAVSGGGVFVGGEPAVAGTLTRGAGDVTIASNLIKGNQAGAGHGGGIRTQFVSGQDVATVPPKGKPGNIDKAYLWSVEIINNMIVDNLAGYSGGGISMQDTAVGEILNNTVAHNDSTATVGGLINIDPVAGTNTSDPQPAGIATEPHSVLLNSVIPTVGNGADMRDFSNPEIIDNIVWQNRAFSYLADVDGARLVPELTQAAAGDCGAGADYWDLGVVGGTGSLSPTTSVLTSLTDHDGSIYDGSNTTGDPAFVDSYCNGARDGAGPMFALPALDEGGNAWIEVRFGPLVPMGDYHIGDTSSAIDIAVNNNVATDFDGDPRPEPGGTLKDSGADEFIPPPPAL